MWGFSGIEVWCLSGFRDENKSGSWRWKDGSKSGRIRRWRGR